MNYPRVGHINFLNVLPLTYSYKNGYSYGMDINYAVPSILNSDIEHNRLDISPISSIAYARQSDNLFMLPDICIRSDCDVESIVLISKKPINEIIDDKIILTAKSATSHCLLKIIMSEMYGANPQYSVRHIGIDKPVSDDSIAALLIGDDALYMYLHTPDDLYCYDIGKEWYKLTGKYMVYAVWVVRKDFARQSPKLLQAVYYKIIGGMKYGLENKDAAIKSVLDSKPFSYDELNHYLGDVIKWDLTDEGIDALETYYKLAHKLKLIDKVPRILVIEN